MPKGKRDRACAQLLRTRIADGRRALEQADTRSGLARANTCVGAADRLYEAEMRGRRRRRCRRRRRSVDHKGLRQLVDEAAALREMLWAAARLLRDGDDG